MSWIGVFTPNMLTFGPNGMTANVSREQNTAIIGATM